MSYIERSVQGAVSLAESGVNDGAFQTPLDRLMTNLILGIAGPEQKIQDIANGAVDKLNALGYVAAVYQVRARDGSASKMAVSPLQLHIKERHGVTNDTPLPPLHRTYYYHRYAGVMPDSTHPPAL